MTISRDDITGLVLAGGRASRMGGVDKGLQTYRGLPLAMHALLRLAPQVGAVMISANRNLGAYESMGAAVWPDPLPGELGPLGGVLAGLEQAPTRWLAVVPCDAPNFPADLVARLAEAIEGEKAEIAFAATIDGGRVCDQALFCLLDGALLESLLRALREGEREIARWSARQRCARVGFDDRGAFVDVNTADELRALQSP